MTNLFSTTVLLAAVLVLQPRLHAHGELHAKIEALGARIDRAPQDAALRLQRGELLRMHRDWDRALADYAMALQLDPDLTVVQQCRARLHLDRQDPGTALRCLDACASDDADVLLLRGEALYGLGRPLDAADAYARGIDAADAPKPDDYLRLAECLRAAGPGHLDQALARVEAGIARLGSCISLELAALDLELDLERVDAALVRLDRIAAQGDRMEHWQLRRADILASVGRVSEARDTLSAARSSLDAMSARQRRAKKNRMLSERVDAALAELDGR